MVLASVILASDRSQGNVEFSPHRASYMIEAYLPYAEYHSYAYSTNYHYYLSLLGPPGPFPRPINYQQAIMDT